MPPSLIAESLDGTNQRLFPKWFRKMIADIHALPVTLIKNLGDNFSPNLGELGVLALN